MKNKLNLLYILLALGLLLACESEPVMYDASKNHVAFVSGSASVGEEVTSPAPVPVIVTAMLNSPSITVDFEVDADQSVAVEGVDFNIANDSKTLSFSDGWGYDTIWVQPIDNDEFGGNISFVVKLTANSKSYPFGALDSAIVTIVDNEHPLGKWLGTYSVDAKSYGSPGAWDEAWTVSTSPDPDDVTKIIFDNIAGGTNPISGTVDLDAMSITFAAGTNIGDSYGYGDIIMYYGNPDLTVDKSLPIVGTIYEDGSIVVDNWGHEMTGDNAGWVWDVFHTYWTKTASPISDKQAVPNKLSRNDN